MTRGRRPVPTHLQLLRGNPGRRALPESEPEPMTSAQIPEAPPFLQGYACDEWYRIAEELHRLNLLTVVDINPLAAYCDAYARWRTAVEALADMAKCDPVLSGLMTETRNGTPIQNPIVVTAAKAANDNGPLCRRICPSARARIAAGPYGDGGGHSKFSGLPRFPHGQVSRQTCPLHSPDFRSCTDSINANRNLTSSGLGAATDA